MDGLKTPLFSVHEELGAKFEQFKVEHAEANLASA